jgi:hypothetical protein
VARAAKRPRSRIPQLRPSEFPSNASLDELYAELMKYPNVEGCYVGEKWQKRKKLKKLAVVCCVRQKGPAGLRRDQYVPKRLTWPRTRGKTFSLTSDVCVLGASELQQVMAVVGPGDELQPSPAHGAATLGVVLKHPTLGRVVTTAGHALIGQASGTTIFDGTASPLSIANTGAGAAAGTFTAMPLKAVRVAEADYALLRPTAEPRNLYQDQLTIAGHQFARPEDVGKPLFVLTRRTPVPTVLRGVAGAFTMGGVAMRGLLLTDPVTIAGDSGCALVDSSSRVWGLLVGLLIVDGQPRSIFGAADWVMALETAEMG